MSKIQQTLIEIIRHIRLISNISSDSVVDRKQVIYLLNEFHLAVRTAYQQAHNGIMYGFLARDNWVSEFGWFVPTLNLCNQVITFTGSSSEIVIPAAGLGFLHFLLNSQYEENKIPINQRPIITSSDLTPDPTKCWCDVKTIDGVVASQNAPIDSVLIIAWALYGDELGTNMLLAFRGDRLIVIGESHGCTASDSFFDELEENWEKQTQFGNNCVINWYGIRDCAEFYCRRSLVLDSSDSE